MNVTNVTSMITGEFYLVLKGRPETEFESIEGEPLYREEPPRIYNPQPRSPG